MDGPAIRVATSGDAGRVLALWDRLEGRRSSLPPAAEPLPRTAAGFGMVADPGAGEPLAGYARVEVSPDRRTGNLVLAVDAAWSRRGLGTRLTHAAIDECRRRGLRRVELTAATHHHAAVRLFMACGFQIEGLRRGSLTVDGRAVDEYYRGLLLG